MDHLDRAIIQIEQQYPHLIVYRDGSEIILQGSIDAAGLTPQEIDAQLALILMPVRTDTDTLLAIACKPA